VLPLPRGLDPTSFRGAGIACSFIWLGLNLSLAANPLVLRKLIVGAAGNTASYSGRQPGHMNTTCTGRMIRISYLPDARYVEASAGDTVLQAALRAGIRVTHACGSNARCSTCRVAILEGLENCTPRSEAEQAIADHLEFKPMIRLACQTQATGPMTVRRLVLDDEDEELAVESMADPVVEAVGEERQVAILFADIRGFTAFGIGLHYGAVVVGSIGWGAYKRRTVVGDAVNFASRSDLDVRVGISPRKPTVQRGPTARHPAKIGTSCRKKTQNPCIFSAKRSSSSLSERAGSFFRQFLMIQTSASFEVRQAASLARNPPNTWRGNT